MEKKNKLEASGATGYLYGGSHPLMSADVIEISFSDLIFLLFPIEFLLPSQAKRDRAMAAPERCFDRAEARTCSLRKKTYKSVW